MNYCRRCQSDYEKPGTCNCFAEGGDAKPAQVTPVPVIPWAPPYPYVPVVPLPYVAPWWSEPYVWPWRWTSGYVHVGAADPEPEVTITTYIDGLDHSGDSVTWVRS